MEVEQRKTKHRKESNKAGVGNKIKEYSLNHTDTGLWPASARVMVLRGKSSRGTLCSSQSRSGLPRLSGIEE